LKKMAGVGYDLGKYRKFIIHLKDTWGN